MGDKLYFLWTFQRCRQDRDIVTIRSKEFVQHDHTTEFSTSREKDFSHCNTDSVCSVVVAYIIYNIQELQNVSYAVYTE